MRENEQRTTVITFGPFFQMEGLKGMTDSFISKKAGIDVPTLKMMRRRADVPFETIRKICHALECQPGDSMEACTIYVIPASGD